MEPIPDHVTDREIMDAMDTYGGSFVCALAEACFRADDDNLRRIKAAFPELWEKYTETALAARGRAQRESGGPV